MLSRVWLPLRFLERVPPHGEDHPAFVKPGDLVGIWGFGTTVTFTTDKKALLKALPPNSGVDLSRDANGLVDAAKWLAAGRADQAEAEMRHAELRVRRAGL